MSSVNPLFTPPREDQTLFEPTPLMMGISMIRDTTSRLVRGERTTGAAIFAGTMAGAFATGYTAGPGYLILGAPAGGLFGYATGKAIQHMRKRKEETTERTEHVLIEQPGQDLSSIEIQPVIGSLKKGGTIHKTGLYKLHKGEKVIPK